MLEIACGVAKNKYPDIQKIIGIAMDAPKFTDHNSEDLLLMECHDWSEESRQHYQKANELLGFFETQNLKFTEKRSQEFPESKGSTKKKKVGRSDLCPCGSGKKYKYSV